LQFARFCEDIIVRGQFAELRGRNHTLHYAPNLPLSKYDLVCLVDRIYGLGLRVIPADDPPPAINRVLASRFLSLPLDSIEPAIVALRDWAQDGVVRMSRAALEGRPTSVAAGPR
jgi:hypothetical protein